ncbi:MAG TPA: hypothetical protein EYQ44_04390 [Porticoccaceae bacterium]|nr:hypothetical protein [Porticoccaceae bacterium]HIK79661.1 hypothetical protein [Porticoccaceae bacterium]
MKRILIISLAFMLSACGADYDRDNDGVINALDAHPDSPAESADSDRDGVSDNGDWDGDNDGIWGFVDWNGDGIFDNEGTHNIFPLDAAEWSDHDGIGNNSDEDFPQTNYYPQESGNLEHFNLSNETTYFEYRNNSGCDSVNSSRRQYDDVIYDNLDPVDQQKISSESSLTGIWTYWGAFYCQGFS